jgi:tetratricopeptide (TPR) repeat protein
MYYHLGVSHANCAQHDQAILAYDQAILLCPHLPHYLHERAKSLQVVGEHDKALHDFTRVLELQPTNARLDYLQTLSVTSL